MNSQGKARNRQHMLTDYRRQVILARLQQRKAVKTSDLSQTFSVSSMTIRNDLNALAKQGQLVRVHGGAVARQWLTSEPSYEDKTNVNRLEKEAIGRQALKGIFFDLAFLGSNGISLEHGLTIPSLEEAETAAEVIAHSQRTIVVADHTKFGTVAHGKIADISEIDAIITDSGLDSRLRDSLSSLDVEIDTVVV